MLFARLRDEDVQRVLALAYGPGLSIDLPYPDMGSLPAEQLVAERTRRAVAVVQRDARFREAVLGTYDFRCAISGFSIGGVSRTRVAGLLDAAHIRPVWEHGPDVVRNGLSLTPTLHRLFDLGMFTLEYERDSLRIVTSPQLEDTMIRAPDDSFRMGLATGIEVRLPQNRALWPDPALLRHHQASTYREAGTPR